MNKKKSVFVNIVATLLYQIVTMIAGFIVPALILSSYGAEVHGYTSTVTSIMGYIVLLNAGLATASIQSLYSPLAQKDHYRTNQIVNAIDKLYIRTGVLYTIAVFGAAAVLPFLIKDQLPIGQIVGIMIVMGGTQTMECFIYSKWRALLQADQRLYVVSFADTFGYLLRTIIQVILLRNGCGPVIVLAVPAITVVLRMIVLSTYCRKHYSYLDKRVKEDRSALSNRWSAFVHQIAGLIVNNTDVVLLTVFRNLVEVSIYSVYNLVFNNLYKTLTNVFAHSSIASFGHLIFEDKLEKLGDNYNIYEFIYYYVISVVYAITACMLLPFIQNYTRMNSNIHYVDYKLAIFFICIGIANNARVPCGTIIDAAGHFKQTQNRAIIEAVINIVVSILLLPSMGMYGLLIGTICSFAYRTTDIIVYAHRHILKRPLGKTISRLIRVVFIVSIAPISFQLLCKDDILSWTMWVFHSIVIGIIVLCFTTIMNVIFDRDTFYSCVHRFMPFKKGKMKR